MSSAWAAKKSVVLVDRADALNARCPDIDNVLDASIVS